MKLPGQVRVAGYMYQINTGHRFTDSRARWAETDKNEKAINFGELCSPKHISASLLHELMHACWEEYGLKDISENEERIVSSLSDGLYQVLQDLGIWPVEIEK